MSGNAQNTFPDAWRRMQLKRALISGRAGGTLIKGRMSAERTEGLYPGFSASGQDVWVEEAQYRQPGIVLSAVGARCGKCFKADGEWTAIANTHVLLPRPGFDRNYLWYVLNREDFWEKGGTAQPYVRVPDTLARPFAFPDINEQRAIVDFLDCETAKIDALIANKLRLISALTAKREALIRRAVTGASQPHLRPSNYSFIGDVPSHWTVCELRRKWKVIDCKHRTATYVPEGIPIVSTTEVKPGRLDLTVTRQTSREEYLDLISDGRKPKRHNIIYSRNASIGAAAYVDTDEPFCMGQDVCLITSDDQDQLFLTYQLNSRLVLDQVDAMEVGATFKRINVGQIKTFTVCVPPVEEQRKIASYLDGEISKLDGLIEANDAQCRRLSQYRSALISASVRGQIRRS